MKILFIFLSMLFSMLSGIAQTVDVKFEIKGAECVNSEITFTDNTQANTSNWKWDFGNGKVITGQKIVKQSYEMGGNYNVKLTVTVAGLDYSKSIALQIYENPKCQFEMDTVNFASFARVFTDKSSTVGGQEFTLYFWDFGNGEKLATQEKTIQYKYNAEGDYTVWHKVMDKMGCSDSVSQNISVKDIYKVPNVFTPNGDGINDLFIVSVNGVEKFSIEIFSRWGNLVFKREGVNQIVWDGRMPDGSKLQTGTYFYVIKASDSEKEYLPEKGHITIFCEK